MGKINVVLSFKGGVGKTTVCAAMAYNSAADGKKTLAVDMDFGVRSLDLALGHQNDLSANVYDVILCKSSLEDAVVCDERSDNLHFLPAPAAFDDYEMPLDLFCKFLETAKDSYDEVFLDMSAGKSDGLELCVSSGLISSAIIVSSHNDASIRAAEKMGTYLFENNIEKINLIINCFSFKEAKAGRAPGIVEIIERSSVSLIGVIPYDDSVEGCLRRGEVISRDRKCLAGRAMINISRRLKGENVPVLEGVVPKRARAKLY